MLSYPRWAEPPETVRAGAISIINFKMKRSKVTFDSDNLAMYVRSICLGLSSGDDSLKQHLVYFLCKLISEDRQDMVDSFLDLNVFQPLVSSMLHTNYMFRFYLAKLCAILYETNLRARQEFIKEYGVRMMVGQINLSPLRGCLLYTSPSPRDS